MATPSEILSRPVCTVREAAELSTLSRAEIYNRAKSGALDSVVVGKRVLIKTESLRRLLGVEAVSGPPAA